MLDRRIAENEFSMNNSTPSFKVDMEMFKKSRIKRVFLYSAIACGAVLTLHRDIFFSASMSIKFTSLIFLGAFFLYQLLSYMQLKKKMQGFSLYFSDRHIHFSFDGKEHSIPCKDLEIIKLKKVADDLTEIKIKTKFGQKIDFNNFEKMNDFYKELSTRISANH